MTLTEQQELDQARARIEAMQQTAILCDAEVASISGITPHGEPFCGIYAHGPSAQRLARWIARDAQRERHHSKKPKEGGER